jgi:hypothetical protein
MEKKSKILLGFLSLVCVMSIISHFYNAVILQNFALITLDEGEGESSGFESESEILLEGQ